MRIHRDAHVRTLQHLGAVSGPQQQVPAGSRGLAAPGSPSSAVRPHCQRLKPCLAPLLPRSGCRSILPRSASCFPSPEAAGCGRLTPSPAVMQRAGLSRTKSKEIANLSRCHKRLPGATSSTCTDPAKLGRAGLSWAISTASSGKPRAPRTRTSPAAGQHSPSPASPTHA